MKRRGFSLIELLVVIGIVAVLATVTFVYLGGSTAKARDTKRKADLSQIGRFLTLSCFTPAVGAGDYDLSQIAQELVAKNPQYSNYIGSIPQDPKTGSSAQTNYRYIVDSNNRCALYANLENKEDLVTLSAISAPTPGGGQGVLHSPTTGWNGTELFFQYSN